MVVSALVSTSFCPVSATNSIFFDKFVFKCYYSNMGKTSRDLLRHGAGLVVGLEMIKLGNRLQENAKQMKKEAEEIKQQNAENVVWEYRFEEFVVENIVEVTSELVEAILRNGVEVDPAIMGKAKELIDTMTAILNFYKDK